MASFFRRKSDDDKDRPVDASGVPVDPDPAGRAYDEWNSTASNVPDPGFRRDQPEDSDPDWNPIHRDASHAADSSGPYDDEVSRNDGDASAYGPPYDPPYDPPYEQSNAELSDDQRANRDQNFRANRGQNFRKGFRSNRTARFLASGLPLSMVGTDSALGGLVEASAEFGWSVTASEPLADQMLASLPVAIHGYRAGNVVSGRFDPFTDRTAAGLPPGEWAFTAFDALEDSKMGRTVRQCFTAVPSVVPLPDLRILPTRFRVGPTRGMVVYPTVDQVFDARYRLMAQHGDTELEVLGALVNDDVRSHLLGATDSDEVWTADGQIIVTTSTPHNEDTLARHLGILGAILRALRTSSF